MPITNGSDSEGDAYRIIKVVRKDYFPPNFKKYMLEEQLKWSRHEYSISRSVWGWVFWSQQDHEIEPSLSLDNCADFNSNVCAIPKVRDNIRSALQKLVQLNINPLLNFNNCLVQLWAATKTLEGRTKLTTQYQPFALGITWRWNAIDRHHFCEYRMRMCREYDSFYADAEGGEEQLGIPGRVFLHKSPEITPDVKLYSEKEYPQRNLALVCGIEESWALPVFERSSQTCVGVLEMVASYSRALEWQDESFLHKMRDIFQGMMSFSTNWSYLSILVLAPRIMNQLFSTMSVFYSLVSLMLVSLATQPFKKYMLEEQLKWSRHEDSVSRSDWGWVFWSQHDHEIEPSLSLDNRADFNSNVCAIPKVRDNIRRALQKLVQVRDNINPFLKFSECLVQFWAATKTLEGRTKLTTQYQPFALGVTWRWSTIDRHHFCEYRMRMCREYNCFYADAESGEEQLGIPGRVFLHKSLEFTPDVKLYSEKEYPQRNLALVCGIEESWALPVFERSSQTCVGVLEMVASYSRVLGWHHESFFHKMHDIFQEFGLICLDGYTHYEMQVSGNLCSHAPWSQRVNLGMRILSKREAALEELDMVLTSVCVIHELPLALTWIPCSSCNGLIRGQFMSEVLEYVEDTDEEDFVYNNEEYFIADFSQVSKFTHLRKGGVSERALSSPSMLYCPDITQLSIAEYPFVHYAHLCKLSGLFTICLQSNYTEKEVYVVEFFLSTSSKDDENILTTLSLILGTMEKNFKTFKFASGQQLGEVSSAEVMGFQNGQKLPFVQMIQAPRLSPSPELLKDRGLMLQLGQLDQPSTDAIHSEMNVINEEQSYILPSLQALQNGEATMQLDSPHQPPLDASNNGHNVIIAEENVVVVASLEEGKRKKQREHKGTGVRIEVSLDAIIKCAEMKMKRKGAAEKLKVSTSTFKRACREYGIDRWPPRNVENVGPFWPPPVGNQVQTPQLNSNLPSNQAAPGVTHKNSGFQDANRVTIRAKYRNKTIKFRLSFSSRLVEFQQEVPKRLNLEFGTYYAEYKDAEGELIFIACDDDLQDCLQSSRSQGNASIEVLLKLEEPLFDLNPAN